MFQLFQNHYPGAFPHDKAFPLPVKRNGTPVWIGTVRKRCQRGEAGNPQGRHGSLRAACHAHVRLSILNGAECLSDGIGACGTGCGHIQTLALQPIENADIPRSHIGNHQRHEQRIHSARALFRQPGILSLRCLEAAHTAAHNASHPVSVLLFHIQRRVRQGLSRRCHRILTEKLHPSGRFFVHIVFRLKVFHLRSQLTFVIRSIKPCDRCETDFPLSDTGPELLHANSDGGHRPHTRNDYSSSHFCSHLVPVHRTFSRF